MGFWSTLGKIGLGIGAGVAAPLTGGASLTALPTILGGATGAMGALGGVASGRQQGRETEATFQQRQDQLAQGRYQNELDAARLNLQAPTMRAQQSVRGDILANAQPFQITGTRMMGRIPIPTTTGGLSPALFSDDTRSLGRMLSAGAVGQQGVNDGRAIEAPPQLTPLPRVGRGGGLLNLISQIAPFLSLIPSGNSSEDGFTPPRPGNSGRLF